MNREANMSQYTVKPVTCPIDCVVEVPGSKSITNRALLMAALGDGVCHLNGVLFSDDSRHFLSCLEQLGYTLNIDEHNCKVTVFGTEGKIPYKNATINVGSAGTAARFLTAMLALSDGEYKIDASEQMKKRPMKPLFEALTSMGATFTFLENEGFLPVLVKGAYFDGQKPSNTVDIDISKSTQFLSALMMVAPVLKEGLSIYITSEKKDGSYIRITTKMMEEFGCNVYHKDSLYQIKPNEKYKRQQYQIEPDVSAACYFYAAAAITGGKALVRHVHADSMQGDIKFIYLLEKLGCMVTDTKEGISLIGTKNGQYNGIDVDMNDFSDQSMTMAVVAAFAQTPTYIRNIGHIRLQESDRIKGIVTELRKLGITVEEHQDAIRIVPSQMQSGIVKTYDDHRMAMAFALAGLRTSGIIIDDYQCCKKTFENYFEVLESIIR
jgi:3-phosphoshikimate 1-carboxyvinyltransferase